MDACLTVFIRRISPRKIRERPIRDPVGFSPVWQGFSKETCAYPACCGGAGGARCQTRYLLDFGMDQATRASNLALRTAFRPKSVLARGHQPGGSCDRNREAGDEPSAAPLIRPPACGPQTAIEHRKPSHGGETPPLRAQSGNLTQTGRLRRFKDSSVARPAECAFWLI